MVNDYCDTALHILVCLVLKNPKSSFISLKNTALKKSLKPSVTLILRTAMLRIYTIQKPAFMY